MTQHLPEINFNRFTSLECATRAYRLHERAKHAATPVRATMLRLMERAYLVRGLALVHYEYEKDLTAKDLEDRVDELLAAAREVTRVMDLPLTAKG